MSKPYCGPTRLAADALRFAPRAAEAGVGRLFSNLIMEKDHTPINNANTENKTKERRPLGVWVLTAVRQLIVEFYTPAHRRVSAP